jgi:ATP-dependent helicase HrpA
LLRAVRQDQLDWLVPGLFEPLCEQLVRGLPKSRRRVLAPLADKLETLCSRLLDPARYRRGRIELAIGDAISVLYGVDVPVNTWDWARVDAHLRMNVQVCDEQGRLLKQGRALADLVAEFTSEPDDLTGPGREAQTGLLVFPDRGVDAHVLLGAGSERRIAYPALEDRGDSVALVLCDQASVAQRVTGRGLTRLVLLRHGSSARAMLRELKSRRQMELHFATLGNKADLHQGVLHAATRLRFFDTPTLPASRAEFDALIDARHAGWFEMYVGLLDELERIFARRFELMRQLAEDRSPAFGPGADALHRHLDRLLPGDFLDTIPATVFADTARYLDAMLYRWAHLQGRVDKDAAAEADLQELEARLDVLVAHGSDPDWELRHMLEELRVASFAQPVGTRYRVSVKRSVGRIEERERSVGIG